MLDWAILPFKRYLDFKGRSRRKEFWSFFLLNVIIMAVLYGITLSTTDMSSLAAVGQTGDVMAMYGQMFSGFGILILLYGLATFIPNIAVSIRRLHDRDMSGWWLLGLYVGMIIPIINFIASIAYLVLMLLPGTPGPNRFGPDPKAENSAEVFS